MEMTLLLLWFGIFAVYFDLVSGLPGTRVNHHGLLMKDLMKNYANNGGKIRPVYDPNTVTNVTWRLLFHNLIDMDTRNQKFTIVGWLKETWIDEFLMWNATEYGGITKIQMPVSNVWVPDITMYSR
ncbi:neuronal acetylcholine receptor subunit alpha-10-like [Amphiura filiformis]|uniref:neuronal acetylcholine receptor subunit alpha-10-like n=1 Tax=Amphiura filiformis TaxID=82378 RepID=UPI003B20D551